MSLLRACENCTLAVDASRYNTGPGQGAIREQHSKNSTAAAIRSNSRAPISI